jgi:hypothetical protein
VVDAELDIAQRYQMIDGSAAIDGATVPLERGRVQGELVFFRLAHASGDVRFEGQLKTDRIVGKLTTPDGRTHPWRALRNQ